MIRTHHSGYPVAALTHPGMTGKNNEDRYAVSAYRLTRRSRKAVLLAVLADGIGGHRAGEVASELAVERISQAVAESDGRRPVETLQQAIIQASQEIYSLSSSDVQHHGMGTTCVCAWIIDKKLYSASVGDSRLYLMRGGKIVQLSTDHTWVQEAVEQGLLTPQQVKGHPNQHIIRRYIGSPTPPEVDVRLPALQGELTGLSELNQGLILKDGDRLLLCSDGLTDLVNEKEILAAFESEAIDAAGQSLLDLANQRGGHDNITLIAIQIPKRSLVEWMATSNRLFSAALMGAVLLTIFLFISLVMGFDWLNNRQETITPTPMSGVSQPTQGLPVTLPATSPAGGTLSVQPPTLTPAPATRPALLPTATRAAPSVATPTVWPTNTLRPWP